MQPDADSLLGVEPESQESCAPSPVESACFGTTHSRRSLGILSVVAAAVFGFLGIAITSRGNLVSIHHKTGYAQMYQPKHQPHYARVDGHIETIWQRPAGRPKGIFFIAHGCRHQATDVFQDFPACSSSYFGRCSNLPEEADLRDAALARDYIVMAVSGGTGKQSCWFHNDYIKVRKALVHVKRAEGLPMDTPVLASGVSSGGTLMGSLAMKHGLPHLKCIVPIVSGVGALVKGNNYYRQIPTLFVYMPRDKIQMSPRAKKAYHILKRKHIRVDAIEVRPRRVTGRFLERCLPTHLAEAVALELRKAGILDEQGFIKQLKPESKKFGGNFLPRDWVAPMLRVIRGKGYSIKAHESCLDERMNVAWAFHEMTSQYSEAMLDFCEEVGDYTRRHRESSHH